MAPLAQHANENRAHTRRKRAREGAVMLVVLLILLVATASATVSVSNTQAELQASGNERVAMQTRYVAEIGLMTGLTWAERANMARFGEQAPTLVPLMKSFAEPAIVAGSGFSMRQTMESMVTVLENPTLEVMPVANAVPHSGSAGGGGAGGTEAAGAGGSGGSGVTPPADDTTGSFGPDQKYGLPQGGFVVDFTDCIPVSGVSVGGMSQNEGAAAVTSYSCVLTARGRLEPPGDTNQEWTLGSEVREIRKFSSANDARAQAIVTQ
jgi:hypothetical protein